MNRDKPGYEMPYCAQSRQRMEYIKQKMVKLMAISNWLSVTSGISPPIVITGSC
jgi:hypothetical protein